MNAYPPGHLTPKESKERSAATDEFDILDLSDETLRVYAKAVLESYRSVLEHHFSQLAPYLPFYNQHPYQVTVVRIGRNGTLIGYTPAPNESVTVMRIDEFNPPLSSINLFDIKDRLKATVISFDFSRRLYDRAEAEMDGTRMALKQALDFLWLGIDGQTFEKLCMELLEAEGFAEERMPAEPSVQEIGADTVREVLIDEPAGFRRVENWAFEFKHHRNNRVSAKDLREIEARFNTQTSDIDVLCLITSGDLTTIGRAVSVENPRVRVWDRTILNQLVNKYLPILEKYFAPYPRAVQALTEQFNQVSAKRYDEFTSRLAQCPSGREHFRTYETIGTELWQYIFEGKLGGPRVQHTTSDGVQRRDCLFPNLRRSYFFQRVFDRFHADFVIVDFKNYGDPINSGPIEEARTYANKALGNFVVVVSRKGGGSLALDTQIRLLRDDIVVLTLSDAQMLEMVSRKELGEEPEDLLTDLLDELLMKF